MRQPGFESLGPVDDGQGQTESVYAADAAPVPDDGYHWLRPLPPPRQPVPVTEDPDFPWNQPGFGLWAEPCPHCGGAQSHWPLCPTGLADHVDCYSRPERIALLRCYEASYDPVAECLQVADVHDANGEEAVAEHWRRVACAVESKLLQAGPTTTPGAPPRGETALEYLARKDHTWTKAKSSKANKADQPNQPSLWAQLENP